MAIIYPGQHNSLEISLLKGVDEWARNVRPIATIGNQWTPSKREKFVKRSQNDMAGVRANTSSYENVFHKYK